ncbi:MAG: serine/threonine protein kinase [Deltaproteobacteria bacterium]|nr:MAG: serine/threonine protein kinase [Deltaproteobacteria bacterium]
MIGTTLDRRYQILDRLGEGGMGVVYLAQHILIEKRVAIKVLKPEAARDPTIVRRFIQEAKAASRIGHPNIVDVTDFGTTRDGTTFQVMELVEGPTLAQVLSEHGRLYVARAVGIAVQIGRALAAAHGKGIVHRDVKPENVFLVSGGGRTDFVKLADFGIAKVTHLDGPSTLSPRLTRQGAVFGTPEYMPPEQAMGRADLDHRADVYALGAVLYHMVTGRPPHKGATTMETLVQVIQDPVRPPGEVAPEVGFSDAFERVVMRALESDRDRRFGSMAEFIDALQFAAGGADAPRGATAPPARADPPVAGPADPTLAPGQWWIGPDGVATLAQPTDAAAQRPRAAPLRVPPEQLPGPPEPARRGGLERRARAVAIGSVALVAAVAVAAVTLWPRERAQPAHPRAIARAGAAGAADDAATRDAGAGARDAATATDANADGGAARAGDAGAMAAPVRVVVTTAPPGGRLVLPDGTVAGVGRAALARPRGVRLRVRCVRNGYRPGAVVVAFDGRRRRAVCRMRPAGKCVPGIKNPFYDCDGRRR